MVLLLQTARSVENRLEAVLEEVGLSGPKYAALSKLVEGPLSLGELASKLTCVRSNVTQLVDRLEIDKLAHRVNDPHDRRSIKAQITAAGRERHAQGASRVKKLQMELADFLGRVDVARVSEVLTRLAQTHPMG